MSTPKVQYGYADGSSNTIRPTTLTYPNGRVLTYDYGEPGGINDAASRVEKIVDDDDTVLAQYEYLGLGTAVTVDYPEPQVKYTLVGTAGGNDPDTGDVYRGLDRFGRVKDCQWYDYGSLVDAARIQYGYDRASNRTYRQDPVAQSYGKGFDELYAYDRLHRLKDMQRGTLNSPKTAITGGTFAECWSLDPTGNWKGYRRDDDGTSAWDLIQQRTANPVNEINNITNAAGPVWSQPAYDPAGNMTAIPQPKDPTKSYVATYDAWNRLTKLVDAETSDTVAEYQYDARRFRIVEENYESGSLAETRHHYYNSGWQKLEERLGTIPDSANADYQFAWGLRSIDDLVTRDDFTAVGSTYGLSEPENTCMAALDAAGNVAARFVYSAYGTVEKLSAAYEYNFLLSIKWNTFFTSREIDKTTSLYHFRIRGYSSSLGVFLSKDYALYSDSAFAFLGSRPGNRVDPYGLWPWSIFESGSTNGAMDFLGNAYGHAAMNSGGSDTAESAVPEPWNCRTFTIVTKSYIGDIPSHGGATFPSTNIYGPDMFGVGVQAGQLHVNSRSQQDFFEVGLIPCGGEAFVFDAHFGGGLVLQEAEGHPAQAAEVGVGVTFSNPALVFLERHVELPM